MIDLKFSEIIKKNNDLADSLKNSAIIDIKILSNISVHQLKPVFEYALRTKSLNANVKIGEYDNIIQESLKSNEKEIVIIFWELCNIKESFVYEIETFSSEQYSFYLNKIQSELLLLFENLKNVKLVIFNNFSHIIFTSNNIKSNNYENLTTTLNTFIAQYIPANFIQINLDKILAKVSIDKSVEFRNFYLSKTLYTIDFFKVYTSFTIPVILSAYAKNKKAVILDCDNTLWYGIVGEDGIENIALSEKHKNGIYFKEVQLLIKQLAKNGIIIGLCSKNNHSDVSEVFRLRNDLILSSNDIVIEKINWNSKVQNLIEIANELNIGIESFVFIDDSNFEINHVNEKLPAIKTLQVPKNLYEYPKLIQENFPLFFSNVTTNEDVQRIKMYKDEIIRKNIKNQFQNIDDYLESLQLEIVIENKTIDAIERVAQLTQKTNQFNLTTKRYLISDIQLMYNREDYDVLNISVNDKFGSYGLTGICIIKYKEDISAEIESLLLSCRILGRNIEKVFLNEIVKRIKEKGSQNIFASYLPTAKNQQVENFYSDAGFLVENKTISETKYEVNCKEFLSLSEPINYIKVIWKKS